MLFSSSSFSVSMDRLEKCAAAYIPEKNGKPTITIFDTFMNELSDSQPDFEAIRSELQQFTEMLFIFRQAHFKLLFGISWYTQREGEYSKACLQLLKRPDQPFSDAELALPFMIIDFLRMAADRFSNGDILALGGTEISFSDAVEFICNLDMPAELRMLLADKKDQADLLAGGAEALNIWRAKTAQPCNPCPVCMKELEQMHKLLNNIFGKVSKDDLPSHYVPAVLEPPYTLDKLLDNLAIPACHFHDLEEMEADRIISDGNYARIEFAKWLKQLSRINPDNQYKSIAIRHAITELEAFTDGGWEQDRYGDYDQINYRGDYELDYPWTKPYFLWFDTLKDQVEQNNCILPEALKGSCDCTEAYELLHREWRELYEDAAYDISLSGLQSYFTEKDQAFKNFLLERCGEWESYLAICYDDKASNWINRELKDIDCFVKLFADSVPALDAPIEVIGDYLDEHSWEVKHVYNMPPRRPDVRRPKQRPWPEYTARDTYIFPLVDRLEAEMERIAGEENIPVYLREHLIERFAKLLKACSPYGDWDDFVVKFRKDHGIKETCSNFSDDIRKIKEMHDAEESKHRVELAEAAEAERRKVLFEMSHSIKNLMASVSEPLDMLKNQLDGTQRRTVENALAGAGLIRDLAVGVHMSMRGEPGTWRKDVLEPGFGAATLDKIILDAVRHAVSNMFDGKYFAQFVKNYFGKDLNTFMQAQNEWKAAVSAEDTFACINKYFFDFKIDCGESSLNIPIGDRDGTATKLLILFQELFLNAVKYSSFTERERRFVKLDIAITQKNWNIKLSNSAVGRQNAKSSGIGLAVIKNFADLFEAKYDASCKNDTYISNINFSLNK